jgi:hypothetical protein
MVSPGQYKAKGVKGSVQLGETERGTLQIGIDLNIKDTQEQMTTFLYFSPEAAPYSYERLRALGWKGKGPEDIDTNMDIDVNEVDVRVTQPESYKAPDGTMKMGVSKLEILTGAGKVTLNKPLDKSTFLARLKAIGGSTGSAAPTASGGGTPPPF